MQPSATGQASASASPARISLFNLHYQANGHATTDKTRVGLWLQKGPITHATQGPGVGIR